MEKKSQQELKKHFATLLMKWNRDKNRRQMPWKGEPDPYKIWLSEIILQQTRVEQGLNYYNHFIKMFPDINKLARAPDKKIFKLWEGLGYYTRCRNLIATARNISKERNGRFPDTYDEILALKGVGPYTAAAISSFAFNLPHAVVDGNVFRVLARVFGIDKRVDEAAGKKYFASLADQLLDRMRPGVYNQAIMDFGAVVCKPVAPLCPECIFRKCCSAFLNHQVNKLPAKGKKIRIKKRWFYYLILEHEKRIAIRQRTEKDIWQDLYEFPMIEKTRKVDARIILSEAERKKWVSKKRYEVVSVSTQMKQLLSHQMIWGQFIKVKLKQKPSKENQWLWVSREKINKYTFPGIIHQLVIKTGELVC